MVVTGKLLLLPSSNISLLRNFFPRDYKKEYTKYSTGQGSRHTKVLLLFALKWYWVLDLLETSYLLTLETDCVKLQTGVGWEIQTLIGTAFPLGLFVFKIPGISFLYRVFHIELERMKKVCLLHAGF